MFTNNYKKYLLEKWLWKSYYRCGSDIFCPTIHDETLEYRLDLSDSHYLKINADFFNQDMCEDLGREGEVSLDVVLAEGFTMEDIFLGLWDRITNKWYENTSYFDEVINEMRACWDEFI